MSKRTRVILIVAAVAIAAYLAYRWYKVKQGGQNPQGLGSNLNSPAPELNAAPSVGPAVAVPVTISISHANTEAPPEEANPYSRMITNTVEKSPLSQNLGRSRMRPAEKNPGLLDRSAVLDMQMDKDERSPYATEDEG